MGYYKSAPFWGDKYGLWALSLVGVLLVFAYVKSAALLYLLIGLCVLFINRPDVLFPVMFIAALNSSVFAIESGTSASRYISLLFIVSCSIKLLLEKGKWNNKNIILAVILVVFSFLSTIMGPAGKIDIFVIMLINMLVYFLFQEVQKVDLDKLINVLCFSAFLSVILLLFLARKDGAFLLSDRFNLEEEANSNNLAMMMEQAGALCFGYVMFGKRNWLRILYTLGTVGAIVLILLTGSRSALIALLSAILFCMAAVLFSGKNKNQNGTVIIFILVIIAGFIIVDFVMGMDNPIIDRFSMENINDGGVTHRQDNMKIIVNDIFPHHILFGSGMGTANMVALGRHLGVDNAAHNIIVDPLTQLGVVGFSLFLLLLIPSVRQYLVLYKGRIPVCMIILSAMTAIVFNGVGEVIFYEKLFWNDLALMALAFRQYKGSIAFSNNLDLQ